MREVICIQVGGAGCRIGLSVWEQLLREHEDKLFPEMFSEMEANRRFCSYTLSGGREENENYRSVFREKEQGKFVPRTLFIDLEKASLTLSEVSDTTGENLMKLIQDHESTCSEDESLFVSSPSLGDESSCHTYAAGRYATRSNNLLEIALERIRKMVERSENKFSFMIVSSIGGGMGSGFVVNLLEQLYSIYSKTFKYVVSLCPDLSEQGKEIEGVNSILSMASFSEFTDAKLFMENKAIANLCMRNLNATPTTDAVNELISLVISNESLPKRFDSSYSVDLEALSLNLPYPRIHNYFPSFGPIHPALKTVPHGYGTEMFTLDAFSCPFVENYLTDGFLMNCSLLYRGTISLRDINSVTRRVKDQKRLKFCSWTPGVVKLGADFNRPLYSTNSNLLNMLLTVSMLSNSTSFMFSLERMQTVASKHINKKSLVHHFKYEGMDNSEILDLVESYDALICDYKEIHTCEELGPDESEN